jgi:hypothetical protein
MAKDFQYGKYGKAPQPGMLLNGGRQNIFDESGYLISRLERVLPDTLRKLKENKKRENLPLDK